MVLHTLRQTIWCTILKDMYNYISSRNISCSQGISMTVMRTASLHRAWHPAGVWQQCERHTVPRKWSTKTWTKHRTTLTAKNVVYQKLKRLACTLPVGSSILGQRLTAKKNHQKPTVSEVLTNTLFNTNTLCDSTSKPALLNSDALSLRKDARGGTWRQCERHAPMWQHSSTWHASDT